jgi:hypothetical protein
MQRTNNILSSRTRKANGVTQNTNYNNSNQANQVISHYILYQFGSLIMMISDRDRAFNHMMLLCNERLQYVFTSRYHTGNYNPCRDIELHMIVVNSIGKCTNHIIYTYDVHNNNIVETNDNYWSLGALPNTYRKMHDGSEYSSQYTPQYTSFSNFRNNNDYNASDHSTLNERYGIPKNYRNTVPNPPEECESHTGYGILPKRGYRGMPKQQSLHDTLQKQTNARKQSQSNDELTSDLLKLSKLVSKIKEKNMTDEIDKLESIYSGIQEESKLDADIKSTKNVLDKSLKNKKITDEIEFSDSSNTESDKEQRKDSTNDSTNSDEESNEDLCEYDGSNEESNEKVNDTSSHNDSDNDCPDKFRNELNELIKARNILRTNIKQEEKLVNKANEKLNDDFFNKRCDEQKRQNEERKQTEKLSIFESDKNTYLKFRSKVKDKILKETNISPLFNYKYQIIKFMDANNRISFTSNKNSKDECYVFDQLLKVINSLENDDDRDCSINDIDEKYLPLCEAFLELVTSSEVPIMTDKKVHDILNNNPEIKKAIFRETAEQTIFEKDVDKEEIE